MLLGKVLDGRLQIVLQTKLQQRSERPPVRSVSVSFPQALLVASKEDRAQFRRRVLIHTLGPLYEQGKISSGLGAQVLGCDRWEFYRLLTAYGFSVLDYAEDEQAYEAETSRAIAARSSGL